MNKLIAVCPRCESFTQIKPHYLFHDYFCGCKVWMREIKILDTCFITLKMLEVVDYKTACKLVIIK